MSNEITPEAIRQARAENPKRRERDLAASLGISEAEFVAAWCGEGVSRIAVDFDRIFPALANVGEVMALTRNDSAVHEKIGVYDNFTNGKHAAMMLGEQIDMRMFPNNWTYGFAVEKKDGENVRYSLQFFDDHGVAVHKIHTRPGTNLQAWHDLVGALEIEHQPLAINRVPRERVQAENTAASQIEELRALWSKMKDTHQFVRVLRKLQIDRLDAIREVGEDFTWQIDNSAIKAMMKLSVAEELPIMCFVGNHACIQIHGGPIYEVKEMGPWINIMDPTFHLHLRLDHISETWAVRKPTKDGYVSSVEAYDANGDLIIQFFGKRIEGQDEREGWRLIVENLPRVGGQKAA